MCRLIYNIYACGHEYGPGEEFCEKYLAFQADPQKGKCSKPLRNDGSDMKEVETAAGDCWECTEMLENGEQLNLRDRHKEAIEIKRDIFQVMRLAGDQYTGKQAYDLFKRFEDMVKRFDRMVLLAQGNAEYADAESLRTEELERKNEELEAKLTQVTAEVKEIRALLLQSPSRWDMPQGLYTEPETPVNHQAAWEPVDDEK